MNPHYAAVAERALHRCEYCHAPEVIFNFAFEVEHIVPPLRGGADHQANWALSCRACNVHKSDHAEGVDPKGGTTVRLFDPRQDPWEAHFRADPETGVIAGLSPIGRATVERLKMNRPPQLEARRQWVRLGLFP